MAESTPARAFNFKLRDAAGKVVRLSKFKGQKVVVYFYPKDFTSGCTKEACQFQSNLREFESLGVKVIGISPDSPARHAKFAAKYDLNFELLADEDNEAAKAYGVWKQKNMYGKKFMGIERSTFLIDENGRIIKEWRKVKVDGHAEEVLEEISSNTERS
ncbi:MAG: thioredoxin-dependent thiol peroxidase [Proteobacteria bacterium]|nr:MAG: thioredoxin-dependent thiol peroxidase [Pseudomonadota bacterium]